ncbi:MAG: hypothetical protein KA198_03765, partial [Chitinophagaceae bacterium]|nr:hypothetical protein [Chitinophagaceae bacterium]
MRNYLSLFLLLSTLVSFAQVPGDTIVVNTFNYASTTRDSLFQFPNNPAVNYEKVLMLYNMRCKNGLVSNGSNTNLGCGEWDYSCNTYLTDSTRTDSLLGYRPSHTISNFSGSSFPYSTSPFYNLYQYVLNTTSVTSINSETQSVTGLGTVSLNHVLDAVKKSGKSQYLFTATELTAAGVIAGHIDGFILEAMNNSSIHFLKIKLKHSNQTALNASTPELTGFDEVFYNHVNFTTGSNRIQFNTPFIWDGISNVLIEFSFTNSTPSNTLAFQGDSYGSTYGLYTHTGNYINTAGGVGGVISTAPFSSINSQITVSFWARGNAGLSTNNTSIIEGANAAFQRSLNIHLPWSNSNIYWDCGNNGGTYDRINKLATVAELEQTWNHWAFTKNTTSGVMNIYLNGALWHSGTGKTLPISIDSLHVGMNITSSNFYKGDIDDLSIWNQELSQATIQNWMNKTVDNSHPNYTNLVAYYRFDEGIGQQSIDASPNAQSTNFSFTPDWQFSRGEGLHAFFAETTERPKVTFLQGSYSIINANLLSYDSILASTNIVKEFAVVSNGGTQLNDQYNQINSNAYWYANYKYIFDGVTGSKVDSVAINPTGTINITNLNFMNRYPARYELMSFVTPYGINLNMGMTGKTWTFDMTDFLPVLKGNRRISIERGGQWQEDLDIKFLFIVGTPPRNVRNISEIWRQPSNADYNQIINDVYFEPRNVLMDPAGASFKIRSSITGHGQEGEFIPRQHYIDINGGTDEFVWDVWKKCATNPVYPQGGTWVYDRAGWCPGMATDLKEWDITPHVTAGQMANIDYGMYTATGDSRYIVTNQLVTYGEMNFTTDAAVADIMAPTDKIEYARDHAICNKPKIVIQNTGSNALTSLTIEYWLNTNPIKSTYTWTGNLAKLEKEIIELPNQSIWSGINATNNEFHVEIKNPNGGNDQYLYNNTMNAKFNLPDIVPNKFIIYHGSNSAAVETKYELFDDAGNSIFVRQNLNNNTVYRDTLTLGGGCYKFVVTDS